MMLHGLRVGLRLRLNPTYVILNPTYVIARFVWL
jgi:hypothetical protein